MFNEKKLINPSFKKGDQNLRFEVAQEIGFVDENNKIGLTQPTTGSDTLTKTDHGNFARFNPRGKS